MNFDLVSQKNVIEEAPRVLQNKNVPAQAPQPPKQGDVILSETAKDMARKWHLRKLENENVTKSQ
jgi:hypothetical protein